MLDLYLLRKQPEIIAAKLKNRDFILDIEDFYSMERSRKKLQIKTENLQSKCNFLSRLIGKMKSIKKNYQSIKLEVLQLKESLVLKKHKLYKLKKKIKNFTLSLPNIPHNTVPLGKNINNNQIITMWGKIRKYKFKIQNHVSLGKKINGFDWFSAVQMSGSRFVIMKDKITLLYRALGQFMLDIHTIQHGYLETYVPYLLNYDSLYGTGQLPKFKEDLFYVSSMENNKNKYILIPTAEVPLTNIFKNQVISEIDLPIMLTAHTPCFRAEHLSYGKDTQGLIRMHQFDKVEIIQISHPEYSMNILDNLTFHAEKILRLLKLPYRKILLSSGDMSFSASKTYDLEVWFPSQNNYREVSSCSNMSDFQSRRIKIKYYDKHTNKKQFVHTINGSGLALGRTLAAILENYQHSDGCIEIPEILRENYMNGIEYIK
ncbi:Serine--tRNA ligase [Buchnera aphidicola (Phyllaphis fagi)]|uniref:serine--tRNA ligase n=1 Tax=Buchnera aphidicola TaxID=9 RepID=UPI0034647B38